jgi:hypothetical protein
MSNDYRKKKSENSLTDWPKEIKFRPTENTDVTHCYEYVSGIKIIKIGMNNLITYYKSN